MIKLSNWFFQKLPLYFKKNDTNRDVNGEGTLQRYLGIFGDELDEEVINKADGYLAGTPLDAAIKSIIDADECDQKWLVYIAYTLGNPPDLYHNTTMYRKILVHIVSYYKIKGTKKAYYVFFALLGFHATIIEYSADRFRYDMGFKYDSDLHYDRSCSYCSDYEIVLADLTADCYNPATQTLITPAIFALLYEIVDFNEPINANLLSFVSKLMVCDDVEFCTTEDLLITVYTVIGYDLGLDYDTPIDYDQVNIITQQTITLDCPNNTTGPTNFLLQEGSVEYITQEDGNKIIIY